MSLVADREVLVRDAVRLRRVAMRAVDGDRDLETVRANLERLIGPAVPRALAARVLGVSQTALDKRIAAGDVPVVLDPEGRRRVPLRALVDLAEEVESVPEVAGTRSRLGVVLERRRDQGRQLDDERILPRRYLRDADSHGHRGAELQALAYHRVVADRLDRRLISDARIRLRAWRQSDLIDPRYADAWDEVLARPLADVAKLLRADTQHARDLRQSSPFAGALSEPERRRVLEAVRRR